MGIEQKRLNQLMREIAERARQNSAALDAFDATLLAQLGLTHDPVLADTIRRSNRLNLEQWLTSTILNPAQMPSYEPIEDVLNTARQSVDANAAELTVEAFLIGERTAWAYWMQNVFAVTDNSDEIAAVLAFSHQSITSFVTAVAKATQDEITRGLSDQAEGSPAKRLALVTQLLSQDPPNRALTERRLGYRLDQPHQAMILWGSTPDQEPAELDRIVDQIAQATGGALLRVVDNNRRRWIWATRPLARADAEALCLANCRLAIGPILRGIEGFRDSHAAARLGQEMLAGAAATVRVAYHEDIRLAALLARDREQARAFAAEVLGALESAPAHLRRTLRLHLNNGGNISQTAREMSLHRNTVMRHLAQAADLLPLPLTDRRIEVAAALEIMKWRL